MDANQLGMHLHDRSTRGESLTPEETLILETWYAQQDAIEHEQLIPQTASTANLAALQIQIETSLSQLTSVTQRIQQIASENDTLRQRVGCVDARNAPSQTPIHIVVPHECDRDGNDVYHPIVVPHECDRHHIAIASG